MLLVRLEVLSWVVDAQGSWVTIIRGRGGRGGRGQAAAYLSATIDLRARYSC